MISIIIPVYNVEKYIGTCIESIIGQSYEALDIILVNNQSTDKSPQICQEYAEKDKRIRVIDCEKNEGPGKARELGCQQAKGQWICYVDSDDYIEPDTFEKISSYIKSDADIYVFGFLMCYEDKHDRVISQEVILPKRQIVTEASKMGSLVMELEQQRVIPYMWNKVYKTEFLRRNSVDFVKTTLMEDFFYNMQAFSCAEHVEVCDYAFYHYRRPYQATLATVYRADFFELSKQRYRTYEAFLQEKGEDDPKYWQMAYTSYIKHLLACLSRDAGCGLSGKQKRSNGKMYLEDSLTVEILDKYQADSWKLKLIVSFLKTKNTWVSTALGTCVYLTQNKLKTLYHKVKRI